MYFTQDLQDKTDLPAFVLLQRGLSLLSIQKSSLDLLSTENLPTLAPGSLAERGVLFCLLNVWMCTCCCLFLNISQSLSPGGVLAGDVPPFSSLPAHPEETGILTAAQMPHAHTGKEPSRSHKPQPASWPNMRYPPRGLLKASKAGTYPTRAKTGE